VKRKVVFAIIFLVLLPAGLSACYREILSAQDEHLAAGMASVPVLHTDYETGEYPEYEPNKYEPYAYEPYIPYIYEPYPQEYEPEYYTYEEPVRRPMVALTFDDGPSKYTNYILDVLEAHGARATFCVLGSRVENWADVILRIDYLGSEVVGHSWNHRNFTRINEDEIKRQILETSAVIEEILGFPPPPIVRAPYGALNARARRVTRELGYSFLNWSLDTEDWRHRDAQHLYNFIMERAIDGSIILMHDIRQPTADAMEYVVPSLIERGFQLVTATELIEYFEGELKPGVEYRGIR